MRIEAVTVCVKYGDFLAHSAPFNRPLLDRWVVATVAGDVETRDVCRAHGIHTLLIDDLVSDGQFAKGAMIDRALNLLSGDAWHLHVDADIVLPPDWRRSLSMACLQPSCLYGWDRCMVPSYAEWAEFLRAMRLARQRQHAITMPSFPVGTRWASPAEGWVPIGYSQLWHGSAALYQGIRHRVYNKDHNDAARTDIQFALQWPRAQRVFLPEVICYHLDSAEHPNGTNWKGRKTARFGPSRPQGAAVGGWYS